jgi:uncharacterized protein YukE
MMDSYQIYCDYLKARKKADKLDEIANKLKKLSEGNIKNELSLLNSFWQGDGMSIYNKKGEEITSEVSIVVGDLRKTANTIRAVAERNYKTEMKALEIARQRDYK